jgi:SSS family transporter
VTENTLGFATIDYVIVIVYVVGIALFGIWQGGRQSSTKDYFLGKDTLPWWLVCFSIVAAETSALTFISIPGLAYLTNLHFLQVTFGYLLGRIVVANILLPRYYAGELSTAYAFLERRFGTTTRKTASSVFIFTRIAADGVRLFATAIPLKLILDIDYASAIVILACIALAYTFFGGVKGVIWVDAVQMIIYIGGATAAIIYIVLNTADGLSGASRLASEAGKFSTITMGSWSGFFQQPYTLIAGVLGGAFLSMASHGTDQLIVQRILATKSLQAGRKALIGSGIIIVFQFALFLVLGLLLYGYYGGLSVEGLGLTRSDEIFPKYIIDTLPAGLSGLIIAGLMAAALSTLSGSMSSMSSSIMLDLIKPLSRMNEEKALRLARRVTIVFAGVLVGSALFFMNTSQTVVELALSIASFTYGGLLGTFLLGLLLPSVSQRSALIGFAAGIIGMIGVISLKLIAWTWFTMAGVLITISVGWLISRFTDTRSSNHE